MLCYVKKQIVKECLERSRISPSLTVQVTSECTCECDSMEECDTNTSINTDTNTDANFKYYLFILIESSRSELCKVPG